MRLIDADELIAYFESDLRGEEYQKYILEMIDIHARLNPIDTVPVRHGKWENTRPDAPMFGFYYCSLCGRKKTSPQDRYCPSCRASSSDERER